MPRSKLLLLFALLASACSRAKEAPATPSPASADGLRPLTSRDRSTEGAEVGSTAEPRPAASSLPPGHPPLSSGTPGPGAAPAHGMPGAGSTAFAHGDVTGAITLAPALASRHTATDVLYVIARDPATRTVVAVKRIDKLVFPVSFTLGTEDAMGAGAQSSGPLEITARISKSGDAIPSSGDLEGGTSGVSFGARGIAITIDKVRP